MKKDRQILAIASIAIITTLQIDARKIGTTRKPTELKKEIKEDTKALEKALKTSEKARTAEEKAAAQKTVYELAQGLLADLKEERTFIGDIYSGYTPQQITRARRALANLEPMRQRIVTARMQKERDLKDVTDEGWLWNAALPGEQEKYDKLSIDINKLKNSLGRIDRAIRNQKVIAGEEWSNAFRTLVAAGIIGVGAVGADVLITGGATTASLPSKAAALASSTGSWVKGKATTLWNKLPSLRNVTIPAINSINDNSIQVGEKIIDKESLIVKVGQATASTTFNLLIDLGSLMKQIALTAVATGTMTILAKKFNELLALINDPEPKPEDIKAKTEETRQAMLPIEKEISTKIQK